MKNNSSRYNNNKPNEYIDFMQKISHRLDILARKIENLEEENRKNSAIIRNINNSADNDDIKILFDNVHYIREKINNIDGDLYNLSKNKFSEFVITLFFDNISIKNNFKTTCLENYNFWFVNGNQEFCSIIIKDITGKLSFSGFEKFTKNNKLSKHCTINGSIKILNLETDHIYSGIIYSQSVKEKKIVNFKLSNRPMIPIGLKFKGIISIDIQIKVYS